MGLGVAGLLTLYNNLVNLLPQHVHDLVFVPMNFAAFLLLVAWVRRRGYSWRDLGFHPERMGLALKWGIDLGLVLPAPLFVVLLLPEQSASLKDPRGLGDLSTAGLAYITLVRIPLGTALCVEAAFRGVLFGMLASGVGVRWAIVGSSVAFGLWHVTPTFELMSGSGYFSNPALLAVAVAAGLVASTVGGLVFAWMRLRTGSVYAPALTHWLVNSLGAVAAYLYAQ